MSIAGRKREAEPKPPVKAGFGRYAYRHMTGLEYDAVPRTNATWLESGDKVMHPTGRARRWHYRPRLQRAAIRWTITAGALAEAYAAFAAPTVAAGAAEATVGTAVAWTGYRTSEAALTYAHRRRIVRPLAKALARPLEAEARNILRGLAVPKRTDKPGAELVVPVPDGWHGDRKAVESVVNARIGGEWTANWRMHQAPFSVLFTRAPAPPAVVKWTEILAYVEANAPGEVVVGLNHAGKPVRGDFVREEPMWGLSIGTGGGKSVFLWAVCAQLVAQGATIVGIDPKFISLDPLAGVPGIELHRDPRRVSEMWAAIKAFRLEMENRYDQWTRDRSLEFARKVLVIEEGNIFSDISKEYWQTIKEKGDPAAPPVWSDIAAILRMGRQANCNVIAVFQRMDDRATGGQGLRDSFGFRMLGRYSWQAWKMLVNTTPIPRSQKRRGRFIVVDGGEHTWIQSPLITESEAHEFMMEARKRQGWETVTPSVTPGVTSRGESVSDLERDVTLPGQRDTPRLTLVKGEGGVPAIPPMPDKPPAVPTYSLAAAAREEIVPMTADALRQAKRRPGFPEADENGKYTAQQLTDWYEGKRGEKAVSE